MEIQVKERLTGALILVALVVWLVPKILHDPAADRASGAAVTEAADGPPLRSYEMELGTGTAATEIEQREVEPAAASVPTPPVAESREVTAEAVAPESERPAPVVVDSPAIAATPVEPAREPAASGGWWVQIGSFSQEANARRLTQQLTTANIPAQLSSVRSGGKELFRVRAGPVADRAAAEALRSRLVAAGHKGSLVAP